METPAKFIFKDAEGRTAAREAYFLPCDRVGRTIHRNDFVVAADDRAWKVLAFEPDRGNSVLARRYDGCRRVERELSPRWLTALLEDADAERLLDERRAYNKAERTIPARWDAMAAACEGDDRLRGAVGYCRELAGDLLPIRRAGKGAPEAPGSAPGASVEWLEGGCSNVRPAGRRDGDSPLTLRRGERGCFADIPWSGAASYCPACGGRLASASGSATAGEVRDA